LYANGPTCTRKGSSASRETTRRERPPLAKRSRPDIPARISPRSGRPHLDQGGRVDDANARPITAGVAPRPR